MRVFGVFSLTAAICLVTTLCLAAPAAQAQGPCVELIQNGGFENGAAWVLGTAPQMPEYVTYAKHSGSRSLVLGITKGAGQKSYSSARQTVTIPPTANTATLSFWFNAMMVDPIKGQYMELVLLTPTGAVLEKPWRSQNDSRIWNQFSFDLSRWRGHTVQVYFNVYNDGQGGTAGMFLDDVSLVACSTGTTTPTGTATPPTPTPTRTPSATLSPTGVPVWTATWTPYYVTPTTGPIVATSTWTPYYITPSPGPIVATPTRPPTPWMPLPTILPWPVTPWPSHCSDVLRNGAFNSGFAGWLPSADALPVQLVTSPVYSPPYALRLGTQATHIKSYSSVRQYITIPAGTRATLQFWTYTWSEPNAGADRQEAILLTSSNVVSAVLWRVLANEQAWRQVALDLTPYAGQAVAVYFNTYNDGAGGRTAMFLDNVQLLACGVSGPPPGPVTVLPPITVGTPQVVPELSEAALAAGLPQAAAAGADPGAALNLTPVMTRIGLALTAAATPTARSTGAPTLLPQPTATPAVTLLRKSLEAITERVSLLACFPALLIIGAIVYLLFRYR